jgi:hypothetical protein
VTVEVAGFSSLSGVEGSGVEGSGREDVDQALTAYSRDCFFKKSPHDSSSKIGNPESPLKQLMRYSCATGSLQRKNKKPSSDITIRSPYPFPTSSSNRRDPATNSSSVGNTNRYRDAKICSLPANTEYFAIAPPR